MKSKLACATTVAALALMLQMGAPVRADVIVDVTNANTCVPFGCGGNTGAGEYQQAYAAADFSGKITITGLSFFASSYNPTVTVTGDFTIGLSYSANPIGSLSNNFADNIGADFTTVFSGQTTQTSVTTFTFLSTELFTYDPTLGDLLLDVVYSNSSGSAGYSAASDPFGESVCNGVCGITIGCRSSVGPATDFQTTPAPAALPLFATGLGAIGLDRLAQKAEGAKRSNPFDLTGLAI